MPNKIYDRNYVNGDEDESGDMGYVRERVETFQAKSCISTRWAMTFMLWWATFSMYLVRVNISDSILDMGEQFGWSSSEKGLVLSSFLIGYVVGQMPGGILAREYGGKLILAIGVGWPMVCTALTPLAASNLSILIPLRVLMGFGESVTYPALMHLLSQWIPLQERARGCTLAYTGAHCGTIFSLFVTPLTMSNGLGWEFSFYAYAAHGMLWVLIWSIFASDDPSSHKWIDPEESAYITRNMGMVKEELPNIPKRDLRIYLALLQEKSSWAIITQNSFINWSLYVMVSWLPEYFKTEWHIDVKSDVLATGYLSALPFVTLVCFSSLGSVISDYFIREHFSKHSVRVFMQCLALALSSVFITLLSYAAESLALSELYLCLSLGTYSFHTSGYIPATLDIAGSYSGYLVGLSNTGGTVAGFAGVYLTGIILKHTDHNWSYVFMSCCVVNVISALCWIGLVNTQPINMKEKLSKYLVDASYSRLINADAIGEPNS